MTSSPAEVIRLTIPLPGRTAAFILLSPMRESVCCYYEQGGLSC
jgi:hypothetical protein